MTADQMHDLVKAVLDAALHGHVVVKDDGGTMDVALAGHPGGSLAATVVDGGLEQRFVISISVRPLVGRACCDL